MYDFKIAISVTGKNSINYWISTEFQRNHITKNCDINNIKYLYEIYN